jgi:hypothetical protein
MTTIESQGIVDMEILEHQIDLDKHFAEWKNNPKINKDENEYGDGGQGELEEYLKVWKKDYFGMFKMVVELSDNVELPAGLDLNKVKQVDGNIEIELDDFDAPHWLLEQRDGLLMNLNNDGEIEIVKVENGRHNRDFSWNIKVENVLSMKWKRSSDEIVTISDAEKGLVIKRSEGLAKLMELAAELDREVRVRWKDDEEDTVWIVKKINFGSNSPEVHVHCDKYINPEAHFVLSELARDQARFVLVQPKKGV